MEARESYTPPEEAYRMAKGAGMDFVTLTDHETIDGALTLTHPDFLVGEEVSAYLPEEEAFFSRVELLTEDPGLRERMARAAREFAAGMSWEAVLDSLIELHSRLASPGRSPNVYSRP